MRSSSQVQKKHPLQNKKRFVCYSMLEHKRIVCTACICKSTSWKSNSYSTDLEIT